MEDRELTPEEEQILRKRQNILKSLIIPDNKTYHKLHEQALLEVENGNSTPRSLRRRDYKFESSRESSVEPLNLRGRSRTHQLLEIKNDNPLISIKRLSTSFYIKIKYPSSKFLEFRDPSPLRNKEINEPFSDHEMDDFNVDEDDDDWQDDSEDELPYRGALSKQESTNSKTFPTRRDRIIFKKLLQKSEPERQRNNSLIINQKKSYDHSVKDSFFASKIKYIHFKDYEIQTWFTAPYPEEYSKNSVLHICEYCLKYMSSKYILHRHKLKCDQFHPPGNEIYRNGENAIFEVDGRKNVIYCQNLCLLAKLFLNSKTLYYDVEPFMFYVLTEIDPITSHYHFVGYFSKEKLNSTNYNVSCILTLPIYQRKGYGNLLMDFSYLLSRREFKCGTPEKPLSDLGLVSYKNYWKITVAYTLRNLHTRFSSNFKLSINQLSSLTGMIPSDVIVGLEQLHALMRDPVSGRYAIKINMELIAEIISRWEQKNYVTLDPEALLWKPLIFGPSCGINQVGASVETTVKQKSSETDEKIKSDPLKDSISILANFLRDDIDDPRNVETQVLEEIQSLKAEDDNDNEDGDIPSERYEYCYPGMNLSKQKAKRRIVLADDEDDDSSALKINSTGSLGLENGNASSNNERDGEYDKEHSSGDHDDHETDQGSGEVDQHEIGNETIDTGDSSDSSFHEDQDLDDEDEHEDEDEDEEEQLNAIDIKRRGLRTSSRRQPALRTKNLSQLQTRRKLRSINY